MEILASLKMFEQVLTLLAPIAVEYVNGKPLEIEIDPVTKQQHQSHRHEDDNEEASRIAENLDRFFFGDSKQAIEVHGLASVAGSLTVVRETKTSSRVGRIFSMLPTVILWPVR
jgi:hypothetical protein